MKNKSLKFLNPILFVLLLLIVIGLIGYKATDLDAWGKVHEICGIMFFILGIVHIYLNWNWVKANLIKKKNHK
jgi:protein-S-isoprenylcysteine O-methyltransferase Ste14